MISSSIVIDFVRNENRTPATLSSVPVTFRQLLRFMTLFTDLMYVLFIFIYFFSQSLYVINSLLSSIFSYILSMLRNIPNVRILILFDYVFDIMNQVLAKSSC